MSENVNPVEAVIGDGVNRITVTIHRSIDGHACDDRCVFLSVTKKHDDPATARCRLCDVPLLAQGYDNGLRFTPASTCANLWERFGVFLYRSRH